MYSNYFIKMWPLCYVTFFHLNNYLGDFHVSAHRFTFLFLMVAEYFIVLIYYNFFNQYPIVYIWLFYIFSYYKQCHNSCECVQRIDSQKWNAQTKEHTRFICEEESLSGTPAGLCLFLLPPLPFSSLSWDFSLLLIFHSAHTFLSYMCGKYVPKLIFYL